MRKYLILSIFIFLFVFTSFSRLKASDVKYEYSDDFFFSDSYIYNEKLSLFSLRVAMSAKDTNGKTKGGDNSIKKLFEEIEFEKYESYNYDTIDNNTIAFAIASKKISYCGEEKDLIAITFRGLGYGTRGFEGNFLVGPSTYNEGYHKGFHLAALNAIENISKYLEENNLTSKNSLFWLSGYSRSAAVGNIASILLSELDYAKRENIFTYTFATPSYIVAEENKSLYDNIFNIINKNDIVTKVPFSNGMWEFKRLGKDIYLNEINKDNEDFFLDNYKQISKSTYNFKYNYTDEISLIINLLKSSFSTRDEYVNELEKYICAFFNESDGLSIINDFLTCEGTDETLTVEKIKVLFNNKSSNILSILNTLSYLNNVQNYYKEKYSDNDNRVLLIDDINLLFSNIMSYYLKDDESIEKNVIQLIINIFKPGYNNEIFNQHDPNIYLANLLMPQIYNVNIGGTWINSNNCFDVFGDSSVSYEPESKTLTLNNYRYQGGGLKKDGCSTILYSKDKLIINLIGENKLVNDFSIANETIVIESKEEVEISGNGKLILESKGAYEKSNIIKSPLITINSNLTIISSKAFDEVISCIETNSPVLFNYGTIDVKSNGRLCNKDIINNDNIIYKSDTSNDNNLSLHIHNYDYIENDDLTHKKCFLCGEEFILSGINNNIITGYLIYIFASLLIISIIFNITLLFRIKKITKTNLEI